MSLSDVELLALHRRAKKADGLEQLAEGSSSESVRAFLAGFGTLAEARAELERRVAAKGGQEVMESFAERMDFNEFLYGWDSD